MTQEDHPGVERPRQVLVVGHAASLPFGKLVAKAKGPAPQFEGPFMPTGVLFYVDPGPAADLDLETPAQLQGPSILSQDSFSSPAPEGATSTTSQRSCGIICSLGCWVLALWFVSLAAA